MNKQQQLQLPCGAATASVWEPKCASALGRILQLFLAFVPNLFVALAKWANVLVGLSAFMGTALGDINSHCSCKAARFHQLQALQDRNKCKVASLCSDTHILIKTDCFLLRKRWGSRSSDYWDILFNSLSKFCFILTIIYFIIRFLINGSNGNLPKVLSLDLSWCRAN